MDEPASDMTNMIEEMITYSRTVTQLSSTLAIIGLAIDEIGNAFSANPDIAPELRVALEACGEAATAIMRAKEFSSAKLDTVLGRPPGSTTEGGE